jgi:UDP-N-acetylmuramate--alanine ligase
MNEAVALTPTLRGRRVHFVGIGGCGMSGLARIVAGRGATCTGTDCTPSIFTEQLEADGIPVTFEQTAQTVPELTDLLVASAAIGSDHPEVAEARRRGIDVLKYAQMLGRLMIGRTGVAVAGTHGKSTTTAMLAHILIRCGLDPTFVVGANCDQIGGGVRVGREDVLIAEACEFDRSFHNFFPTHSVVLNVEEDHLDIYGTFDGVVEAFCQFAERTPDHGSLLIGHEGACRTRVAAGVECPVETIGYAPQADYVIETQQTQGAQHVGISHNERLVAQFDCQLPGEHMAYNASVAAVTAHRLGANWPDIGKAMSGFQGLDRRMQLLGDAAGVTVVDDYGHHPTEIQTTLRALRTHHRPHERQGRLICVFQPHQHARTRFLLEQFATSFSEADVVIVPHIYFVRDSEQDRRAVSAADLVRKLQARGTIAEHIDAFDDIVEHLRLITRPNDLLVVMGAGPVWQVAHQFFANPSD